MAIAACASLGLALAGCGQSASRTAADVPFTACDASGLGSASAASATPADGASAGAGQGAAKAGGAKCSGTLRGAAYEIVMPERWNGTLLLYSHGYRNAVPWSAQDTVDTGAEPAPGWTSGERRISNALLKKGYALAGSSFGRNGWAVANGIKAAEDVVQQFTEQVGAPQRVIAWGDSQGGLITALLAEQKPAWLNGAVSLCGPLAGINDNFDLGLDATYGVKTLLDPSLQLTDFGTVANASANMEQALPIVIQAGQAASGSGGKADPSSAAKLAYLAAIADAPGKTKRYDGATPASRAQADAESLITALVFSTMARQDIEKQFGGNISGNAGTDYASRVSAEEKAEIDGILPGAVAKYNALMAKGAPVTPDKAARARAAAQGGTPTGMTGVPMLTVHTAADSLVVVQNQSVFGDRHEQSAGASGLVQAFTVAPEKYSTNPGAPYGAGHCDFTLETRVGAIEAMAAWLDGGAEPSTQALAEDFGTTSGFAPDFAPGPWPAEAPQG